MTDSQFLFMVLFTLVVIVLGVAMAWIYLRIYDRNDPDSTPLMLIFVLGFVYTVINGVVRYL